MTRFEKVWFSVVFGVIVLLVLAFTSLHIWLAVEMERHPPNVIEACPRPRGK